MYTTQAEAVREWLAAYRKAEEEIDERLDMIRELRGRITGIKAQEITDMPKAPRVSDPLEEYIIRLEEMEGKLDERIREHERDRNAIMRLLHGMKEKEGRDIIRYRYLYGMEWSKIQMMVYHSEQEAERRKMYRTHESALEWMGRFWGGE